MQAKPFTKAPESHKTIQDHHLNQHKTKDEDTGDPSPQLVPSFGRRRDSMPSRLRRWFGQERAVQPSLLLHGLREMPWDVQLCGIATISETWVLPFGFLLHQKNSAV